MGMETITYLFFGGMSNVFPKAVTNYLRTNPAWLAVGGLVLISIRVFSNGVQEAARMMTGPEKIGLYLSVFLQAVFVYLPY